MTFKEWFHDYEWSPEKEAWGQSVWNAAQKAEREKYQELIAAAEAVFTDYFSYGLEPTADDMNLLRDVIEKMKEKT